MSDNFEPTHASSDLGKWVEDLYYHIFCLTDDEATRNALEKGISPGFTANINHDTYTRQEFIDAIMRVRAVKQLSFQSTKDIQFWDAPDNSGAGCVAQYARFTDTYKETGIKIVSTTLLVADVRVVNGQRVLYELTEVLKVLS
ncbi:hypothetical protein RAB80_015227 [Fusarium oxysporum f. sp. vasinfectum]|uniref:SnoaL-like domain-containing protein n=1 Tax=Fusarium oxysporum f. sp. vasinfectum 25433 TaxID=1089449 RepID=X0KXB0_FUSOX|nr:hypothetical protein FOTG_13665 [Fusarium oxysporum f. sp. vasinfectum 25433]KAK2669701.1 hypothetical protein RAB80_015227 [Fusarium oxysporum f. sp. vasinfectum]KAK2925260.1 hypothetical protein FoTM2_015540 [Fusarium oxysporum f. sp. vasinfectum]